jgi:hypothetical protein
MTTAFRSKTTRLSEPDPFRSSLRQDTAEATHKIRSRARQVPSSTMDTR